jgi:glycosyltransferase involved in cell wall biosynthesis
LTCWDTAPLVSTTVPLVHSIIPTKNEELHIARCVESLLPLGPVLVVDSGSTDDTVAIADRCGARVVHRDWTGHSDQKNWALGQLDPSAQWVIFVDADEYLLPVDRERVVADVASNRADGYYLARRFFFLGRRLDHAHWYPDYQLRLFRAGLGRFEDRLVHEHLSVDGEVQASSAELMHENLNGISAYMERLNRYSDLEAQEQAGPSAGHKPGRLLGSWIERRRALKNIWLKLPARSLVRFFWLLLVRRAFLDGRPGIIFSALVGVHDFLTESKALERRLGCAPEDVRARVLGSGRAPE